MRYYMNETDSGSLKNILLSAARSDIQFQVADSGTVKSFRQQLKVIQNDWQLKNWSWSFQQIQGINLILTPYISHKYTAGVNNTLYDSQM